MKMHDDEVDIDANLVRRLVAGQFPDLAGLPVMAINSSGTVNAIYRLGERLYARLPRVKRWAAGLEEEWRWLPRLAPGLTLAVPEPVRKGEPTGEYPFTWAIYRWIDGRAYRPDLINDERRAATDLASFVAELRRTALAADAPHGGRRPLAELDATTREWIASAGALIDGPAVTAAWDRALAAPAWDGTPAWIHGDLLPSNLLVAGGRISAVIDFGGAGIGDPATDVIPAWAVFGRAGRQVFRDALDVDDAMWDRARGIALHQAVALIPYYAVSNPLFSAIGARTVSEILQDT